MNKLHFMIFEETPKTCCVVRVVGKVIHPVGFVLSGG